MQTLEADFMKQSEAEHRLCREGLTDFIQRWEAADI